PIVTSGAPPDAALRSAIAAQDVEAVAAQLGGAPQVTPVRAPGTPDRLLVAVPSDDHPAEIARPLLHRVAQLLALLGAQDTRRTRAARRDAAALLDRLLDDPQASTTAAAYDAEAATLGVQPGKGACTAVWQPNR